MPSEEIHFLVDLECGGAGGTTTTTTTTTTTPTSSSSSEKEEEGGCGDSISGRNTTSRALSYNSLMSREPDSDTGSTDDIPNQNNVPCGQVVVVVVDKCSGGEETGDVLVLLDKPRKKPNMNKSSKPPRPPKGPLLNESDLKLVKELAELAARKRARIERMKAFRKKMKETKRSSSTSSGNITAMVMTLLFFIIIIFQGAFSGTNSRKKLVESTAQATTIEGLMSVQLLKNAPTNQMINQPSSPSFNSLEQASSPGSSLEEKGRDSR